MRYQKPLKLIKFTKEGLKTLKEEYDSYVLKRPAAVAELKRAREMGDLSENGLYKAARMNLSSIDANMRRIARMIKLAHVVEKPQGAVGIGSNVSVSEGNIEDTYLLVGDYEANPREKKISTNSPIGRALLGKKIGDQVTINTPSGSKTLQITKLW